MALYGVSNISAVTPALQAVAAAFKTQLQLGARTATLRRAHVYEFGLGPASQPHATDCEIVWALTKQSGSAGAAAAMTVNKTDDADAAPGTVAQGNFTTEPSTSPDTANVWALGINQRSSYRWAVSPGGPGEFVIPATDLAGLGIRAKSGTYTGFTTDDFLFRE